MIYTTYDLVSLFKKVCKRNVVKRELTGRVHFQRLSGDSTCSRLKQQCGSREKAPNSKAFLE